MTRRVVQGILGMSICAWMAACSSAPAPSQVGVVRGIAVDGSGNSLPGIVVSLRAADGKVLQSVTTGQNGDYEFPDVPVGQYQIFCEFGGYKTPQPIAVTVTPSGLAMPPRLVLRSPGDPDSP